MSDTQTDTSAPSTETIVSPAQDNRPAQDSAASAPNAASEAARTLAQRRAEIRAKLSNDKPAAPPPVKEEAAPAAEEPKAEEKTEQPKAADDDVELAALIAEKRRLTSESKKLAEQRAAFEEQRKAVADLMPRFEKARALLAEGKKVAAAKELLGVSEDDLFWDSAKAYSDKPDAEGTTVVDPEQLAELALQKLEAKRKAAEDAETKKKADEAAARDKELSEARSEYLADANTALQRAGAGKFPGIEALHKTLSIAGEDDAGDVIGARLMKFVEAEGKKTGKILTPAEALAAFEAKLSEHLPRAEAPVAPPSPTITSAMRSDPGRPAAQYSEGTMTLDQIREARRAALRGQPARA